MSDTKDQYNNPEVTGINFPTVAVLMATYNGSKWLNSQLESIFSQEESSVTLYVRDDGSTDSTLLILNDWIECGHNIHVLKSSDSRMGPRDAFFNLLANKYSEEYIALSDQDDLWAKTHLKNSINNIIDVELGLSCSRRKYINGRGEIIKNEISQKVELSLGNALVENVAFGNTIVMKRELQELFRGYSPKNAIMHDSWLYLLSASLGSCRTSLYATVFYRLHDGNAIGLRSSHSLSVAIRSMRRYKLQASELYEYAKFLDKERILPLRLFATINESYYLFNVIRLIFLNKVHRQNFKDDFTFKCLLILSSFKNFFN